MKPEINVAILAAFSAILVALAIHSGNTWAQGMASTAFATMCLAMRTPNNGEPPQT